MINFHAKIDEGTILLYGKEVGCLRDKKGRIILEKPEVICKLRSEISIVFQHFHLFFPT